MLLKMKINEPIFFERNRVYRVYKGGKLFHDFFGDEAVDGNHPEEWIASNVKGRFKDNGEFRGVSKVKGTDINFDELLSEHKKDMLGDREDLGFLVKVLDSGIRLPIQAHPDKEFSQKHFNSKYGKAESWLVLATRPGAKLYFGFKDGITKDDFIEAIKNSETDKSYMENIINEVPVKAGDVFFIPAKTVHAIGYGCLILEVQEPTDFTIQPEAWCGDYKLSDYQMYLGLTQEEALDCFNFNEKPESRKIPKVITQDEKACYEQLIGNDDTDCFNVNRIRITDSEFMLKKSTSVYVVINGQGIIKTEDGYEKEIQKSDYFFVPYCLAGKCSISTAESIELIECVKE